MFNFFKPRGDVKNKSGEELVTKMTESILSKMENDKNTEVLYPGSENSNQIKSKTQKSC